MTIGNKICNTCTRLKLCEGEEKNEEVDSNQKASHPYPLGVGTNLKIASHGS